MNRRTRTALLGSALLLTVAAAVGSAGASAHHGSGREAAALTGKAKLYRSAGDDITFSFDAHLAAKDTADPMKATGTFEWSHYLNGEGGWAKARVDCLVTGGEVAVVSGVVTDTDLPGAKGTRVGITVHDLGRHDRLGYSWATTEDLGSEGPAHVRGLRPLREGREGDGRLHRRALAARALTSARAVTR